MFILQKQQRLVVPRTELTFPAHQWKMYENAAAAPVDVVMADFEDACPYEFKGEPSHKVAIEALNSVDFGDKIVMVRPNNVRSRYFLGDLEAVMLGAPDRFHGVTLPKVSGPEDVSHLASLLDTLEARAGWASRLQIECLIESALGLLNAYRIATASDRMAGLIFGSADFAASIGAREGGEGQSPASLFARQSVVVAAKAAGLHAIDCVYFRLTRKDTPPEEARRIEERLRRKNEEAVAMGMDGSWIIHPQQAEIVNECYSPSANEIEAAARAVEAYHRLGGGSMFNPETGDFEDEATIKVKLTLLAKGVQAGRVTREYVAKLAAKSKAITGYDILKMAGRPDEPGH